MRATRGWITVVVAAVMAMALTSGASPAAAPCRPGPGASCAGADLDGARLQRRNLTGATLTRASLLGARLQRAKLIRANLSRANLTRADLTGADLRGANLSHARLRGAVLRKARLGRQGGPAGRGAGIARVCVSLCEGNFKGADFKGADLSETIFLIADLRGADLSGARLVGSAFTLSNLGGVSLAGADLTNAYFEWTDLRGASLAGADLTGATFGRKVDLRGADLTGVDLRNTDLTKVLINPADLVGARIGGATLPAGVVRTTVTSTKAFTATLTTDGVTVTCTDATACEGPGATDGAATLTVRTAWAGFALCPEGPVRLATSDGGTTYTGTCTFTASQSFTIRVRESRRITVDVKDLAGDHATIARIAFEWRAPPAYELAEAAHACLGVTTCIGDYPEGASVRVVITGTGPFTLPESASCQGGSTTGGVTIVSAPPWELTCLADTDGHPLDLTADRDLTVTLS